MAVEAFAIETQEQGSFAPFTDCEVDRSSGSRCQWDVDGLIDTWVELFTENGLFEVD